MPSACLVGHIRHSENYAFFPRAITSLASIPLGGTANPMLLLLALNSLARQFMNFSPAASPSGTPTRSKGSRSSTHSERKDVAPRTATAASPAPSIAIASGTPSQIWRRLPGCKFLSLCLLNIGFGIPLGPKNFILLCRQRICMYCVVASNLKGKIRA